MAIDISTIFSVPRVLKNVNPNSRLQRTESAFKSDERSMKKE